MAVTREIGNRILIWPRTGYFRKFAPILNPLVGTSFEFWPLDLVDHASNTHINLDVRLPLWVREACRGRVVYQGGKGNIAVMMRGLEWVQSLCLAINCYSSKWFARYGYGVSEPLAKIATYWLSRLCWASICFFASLSLSPNSSPNHKTNLLPYHPVSSSTTILLTVFFSSHCQPSDLLKDIRGIRPLFLPRCSYCFHTRGREAF